MSQLLVAFSKITQKYISRSGDIETPRSKLLPKYYITSPSVIRSIVAARMRELHDDEAVTHHYLEAEKA